MDDILSMIGNLLGGAPSRTEQGAQGAQATQQGADPGEQFMTTPKEDGFKLADLLKLIGVAG